jgi:hypothetical protein
MRLPCRGLATIFAVLILASSAFGAENTGVDGVARVLSWLFVFSPVLLVILWLVIFTRRSGALKQGGYLAKASDHIDLCNAHMARIEQKTDRMIALLESIDRKLSEAGE